MQDSDEPRWVATGPILPLGMFIATLIAALKYPGSPLLWLTVALCAAATVLLIVRAMRIRSRQRN